MKINGRTLAPVVEVLVIPRQDGDIVFQAKPIVDFTQFDAICKQPEPKTIRNRDGTMVPDFEDPAYKAAIETYSGHRINWMIIQSLSATEGLEWETVKATEPSTWANYVEDFKNAGLTVSDVNRLVDLCIRANGLDQRKIDEATKAFLASKAAQASAK